MKNNIKLLWTILFLLTLGMTGTYGQDCNVKFFDNNSHKNLLFNNSHYESETLTLNYVFPDEDDCGEITDEKETFVDEQGVDIANDDFPDWINGSINWSNKSISISCLRNMLGETRSYTLGVKFEDTGNHIGTLVIQITQVPVLAIHSWYPDSDGDGFGDFYGELTVTTGVNSPFVGAVHNNSDHCEEEFSTEHHGCLFPHENINSVKSTTYDILGNIRSQSKTYFNELGKSTQSQNLDVKSQRIWATETKYDSQGRPALQTLSAPISDTDETTDETFEYKTDFIKNNNGAVYSKADFEGTEALEENPNEVQSSSNEYDLGRQYSTNNSLDSSHDITERPYSRTVYSTLTPGTALKTIGGNKINEEWKQGFSYTFSAAQEMYYVFGKDHFPSNPAVKETYYNSLNSSFKFIETNANDLYTHFYFADASTNGCLEKDKLIYSSLAINIKASAEVNIKHGDTYVVKDDSQVNGDFKKIQISAVISSYGTSTSHLDNYSIVGSLSDCSEPIDDIIGLYNGINDSLKIVNWLKATKSVVQDIHGVESVVFTDTDGKTLAAARSGGGQQYPVMSLIGKQGYVDIHIPVGCKDNIEFIGGGISDFKVWNLRTDKEFTGFSETNFPAGFYRIEYTGVNEDDLENYPALTKIAGNSIDPVFSENIGVRYNVNYYDYSLNYYDQAGRVLASTQPVSFDANSLGGFVPANTLKHTLEYGVKQKAIAEAAGEKYDFTYATFSYNALGQLLNTTSPDEGEAKFKYRKDGQIRFSQNSKQLEANEGERFSYTNYDDLGRPVESGVAFGIFNDLNPNNTDIIPNKKVEEIQMTLYDLDDQISLNDSISKKLAPLAIGEYKQTFIASNVSRTENTNTTTWYSYDIYGRVKWVVQDILGLGLKTIDYEYDPVTSAVTKVDFQKYGNDRFVHKYTYHDVSGELLAVHTSEDLYTSAEDEVNKTFVKHADYTYYETGALKRVELAENLQGIDYTYNLAGQLKAINHPDLTSAKDPGGDGANGFSKDEFGMIIDYYEGDYKRNTDFNEVNSDGIDQYNGNIKSVTWNTNNDLEKQTYYYQYNKNNWLEAASLDNPVIASENPINVVENELVETTKTITASNSIVLLPGFEMKASAGITYTAKIVEDALAADEYAVYGIDYDANGNIKTLNRNKDTENNSAAMDKLGYVYKKEKPNQLLRVDDSAPNDTNGADDIKDQDGTNYKYNSIGQLEENIEEDVKYFYTASGLVSEVQKNNVSLVKFFYNDKGFRVRKESFNQVTGVLDYTEHYMRDVAGSVMAIYRNQVQLEIPIYGASRLGVYNKQGNTTKYELTDHLGNVRAVVSKDSPTPSMFADYYPGGMQMPNRNSLNGSYRYAYQGQEKDPETGKEAFQLRLYDSRINRWLTTDPAGQYSSPYLAMGNNPVSRIDPDGATDFINGKTGKTRSVDDGKTDILVVNKGWWKTWVYEKTGLLYNGIANNSNAYSQNEFGAYRFPESGTGFARYTTNANNEKYTIDGVKHTGDNYVSRDGFIGLYKTFTDHFNISHSTVYYGDISAYDPRVNLGHSTHYVGESVDIHYIGIRGTELTGKSAYKNASINRMNIFFMVAEKHGFNYNYSYGNRFKHTGNSNQSLHKDHFHIGTTKARNNSFRLRYGRRAPIPSLNGSN